MENKEHELTKEELEAVFKLMPSGTMTEMQNCYRMSGLIEEVIAVRIAKQSRLNAFQEAVEVVESKKVDVDKMSHDLKGKCDFERNNTCNEIVEALNNLTTK